MKQYFLAAIIFALTSSVIFADNAASNIQLSRLSSYSSLEPAFPKGSLGFRIGLGLDRYQDVSASEASDKGEDLNLANIYIHKGTPWPIDFGILFSQGVGAGFQKIGAHIQWNVYQGFRLPSLSLRYSQASTKGPRKVKMESRQISVAVDYSILSLFTLFAKLGIESRRIEETETESYSLKAMTRSELINEFIQEIGLQVRIIPGYLDLTIAAQRSPDETDHVLAKLGLGM